MDPTVEASYCSNSLWPYLVDEGCTGQGKEARGTGYNRPLVIGVQSLPHGLGRVNVASRFRFPSSLRCCIR